MKVQWRALKRIQCYLQVVDDKPKKVKGKVVPNKVIINNCIKMKRPSTKHLDIDYGKIPKKPKCPRDRMCPCTSFYVETHTRLAQNKDAQRTWFENTRARLARRKNNGGGEELKNTVRCTKMFTATNTEC